jgi:hypothetical protein
VPHLHEGSCRFADHVNEYDEKLNTSITEEGDQRNVLIIGGIRIFLPSRANASGSHEECCKVKQERGHGANKFY